MPSYNTETFKAGEASMLFTADDRGFQQAADRVEKSMQKVAKEMDAGGKAVDGFIVNVRQYTILTNVAHGLEKMGKAAAEMATKIRLGKADVGDLFEKVAEGIPIIGSFVSAGRDLREVFTGEKAYTEVLKEQTAQQDRRTKAMHGFLAAMKELHRMQEDMSKRLNVKPGVGFDVTGILTAASRQSEDLPGKLHEEFDKQLKDIEDQRKELGQKLINLQSQNHETRVSQGGRGQLGSGGGPDIIVPVPASVTSGIAETERLLKGLDDQSRELANAKKSLEDISKQTITFESNKAVIEVLIKTMMKASDAAGTVVRRWVAEAPQMSDVTRQIIDSQITDWDRFAVKMKAIEADHAHGFLSGKLFDQTKLGAQVDEIGSIIDRYIAKVRPAIETNLRFFDSMLGAPGQRAIASLKTGFANFIAPFPGVPKIPQLHEFNASFVGLSQLNSRIQASAASGPVGGQDKIAKDQLAAQKDTAKHTEAAKKAIDELKAAFDKRTFPAIVR